MEQRCRHCGKVGLIQHQRFSDSRHRWEGYWLCWACDSQVLGWLDRVPVVEAVTAEEGKGDD